MLRYFALLAAALALVAAAPGRADVAALQAAIDAAAAPVRQHAMVGIVVRSLTRSDTLYRRDAARVFSPASNQKLLTSAAALDRLGPEYRFVTRVLALGAHRADGTLRGDLALQGGGDPVLATADLEELARRVAAAGVRRVTGSLRADDSRFDAQRLAPGWGADDEPFYYSAQISALSLNRNTVTLHVAPGPRPGWPARIALDPPTDYVRVRNRCVTAPSDAPPSVQIDRLRARNDVTVSGTLPSGSAAVEATATVEEPALYATTVFRDCLRRAGVTVDGPVVWLRAPRSARLLATHVSPTLAEILPLLMKPSDNMIAEMLLKTLGAERSGAGTSAAGAAEVATFLRETGLDAAPHVIADGSGLSRLDLVSPETLCGLLERMDRHRDADLFRRSLPIAGADGTLRRRMLNTPAANNVRAKTGTLSHVTALSGYVTARNGEHLVFSIVTNNYPGPSAAPREMENAICVALAGFWR